MTGLPAGSILVKKVNESNDFIEESLDASDVPASSSGTEFSDINVSGSNVQDLLSSMAESISTRITNPLDNEEWLQWKDSAESPENIIRLNSSNNLELSSPSSIEIKPSGTFHWEFTPNGNLTSRGPLTAVIKASDGTAESAAYGFGNDGNTGMYRVTGDTLGFTTGGILRWVINSNGRLVGQLTNNEILTSADTARTLLTGGTAASNNNTAIVVVNGNDNANNPGDVLLATGNISGALIKFTTLASARWEIQDDGNFVPVSSVDIGTDTSKVSNIYTSNLDTSAFVIDNTAWLTWRNQADDATINVLRVDSSDDITLGSSTQNLTFRSNSADRWKLDNGGSLVGLQEINQIKTEQDGSSENGSVRISPGNSTGTTNQGALVHLFTAAQGGNLDLYPGLNADIRLLRFGGDQAWNVDGSTGNFVGHLPANVIGLSSDTNRLQLIGGEASNNDNASITLYGIDYPSASGVIYLQAGDAPTGDVVFDPVNISSVIRFRHAGVTRWTIDASGNLAQTSNGGNISFTGSNTGVIDLKRLDLDNNIYITWRNSSDTSDVDVIKLDSEDNCLIPTNLIVGSNLIVSGTTTTLNTEVLLVEDNVITLNSTETGIPALDSGLEVERGTSTNATLLWDESEDYWIAGISGTESKLILGTDSPNDMAVMPNNSSLKWRNAANDADLVVLRVDNADRTLLYSQSNDIWIIPNNRTEWIFESGGNFIPRDDGAVTIGTGTSGIEGLHMSDGTGRAFLLFDGSSNLEIGTSTDDEVQFFVNNQNRLTLTSGSLRPELDSILSLGEGTKAYNAAFFSDGAGVRASAQFGSSDFSLGTDTNDEFYLKWGATGQAIIGNAYFGPDGNGIKKLGTDTLGWSEGHFSNGTSKAALTFDGSSNLELGTTTNHDLKFVVSSGVVAGIKTDNTSYIKSHSNFTDSERYEKTDATQTTNNSQSTLSTITVSDNSVMRFKVLIVARYENISSNKSYWSEITGAVRRNNGGSAALVGTSIKSEDDEGSSGYSSTVDVSGNDLRIRVTGGSGEDVNWVCFIDYQSVSVDS